ncbi:hypothetical protein A8F94_12465 [Bacillus sp. FJAT-27225]|uniref:PepSY domain-containing protein n=1 Tax=Bacillus sp. FJAT-27225 TaxID=1743144 RepID=UPI00080C2DDD|nr:PepSY domain-containing protein [Bacillus sp. FJAT-27225]OCA85683.1 hypothetical protein A8F94_12465 [Bacillus sp. FJAT-27225]
MKNKLLVAGLVAGVIIGGTFAVGANEKDPVARQDDSKVAVIETEVESKHGKTFLKTDAAIGNSESGDKQITVEQATEIAKRVATGKIVDIETEYEHGRLEYQIEIKDGSKETEVRIDAFTGKVNRVKLDVDDSVDRDDDDNIEKHKDDDSKIREDDDRGDDDDDR